MVVEVVGGGRKEEELPNAGPTPKEERSGGDNEPVRSRFRLPVCMCRNIDLLKKKKKVRFLVVRVLLVKVEKHVIKENEHKF